MASFLSAMDIEAAPAEDAGIPDEVVRNDLASLHGEEWETPPQAPEAKDPALMSLEQWLGADAVRAMTAPELAALRGAVSKLPEPEPGDSFVWGAIGSPDAVAQVAEATVGYRQIEPSALLLSEAIGANGHFRTFINASSAPDSEPLADIVAKERQSVESMKGFMERLEAMGKALSSLFGEREFTVAAALVACGAAEAMERSRHYFAGGFRMSAVPDESYMEALDAIRRKAVGAAEAVRKACQVNPLLYSRGVLGGVRRSIAEKRAGDFVFAVEALGGRMESRERIQDAGRAFLAYLSAIDAFAAAAASLGVEPHEETALLARLLARRHFRSSARNLGIEWGDVAQFLGISGDLDSADMPNCLDVLASPGASGRLAAVCKDRSRPLSEVREAAYRVSTAKEYMIEAGRRACEASQGVTLGEVRKCLECEPAIGRSREVLKSLGAVSRQDVDALERHLEWMISAYALPVPDEAVTRIIETKADIIPLRLSAPIS